MITNFDAYISVLEEIERAQHIIENYVDKKDAIPHLESAIKYLKEAEK